MVEYALLIASTSAQTFQTLSVNLGNRLAGLNWHMLVYLAIGLLVLRIASWAFRATL